MFRGSSQFFLLLIGNSGVMRGQKRDQLVGVVVRCYGKA